MNYTISRAPRRTPQRTLLNHKPPSNASSGSSTNSARGFSSRVSENHDPDGCPLVESGLEDADGTGAPWVTVGVTLRKALNPTSRRVSLG